MGKEEFEQISEQISAAIKTQEDIEDKLSVDISAEVELVKGIKSELVRLSGLVQGQVEGVLKRKSELIEGIKRVQKEEVQFLRSAHEHSERVLGVFDHIKEIVVLAENRLSAVGKSGNPRAAQEAKMALQSLDRWLPMFRDSFDEMTALHKSLKDAYAAVNVIDKALAELRKKAGEVVDLVASMQNNMNEMMVNGNVTRGHADSENRYASEGIKHDREVIERAIRQMDEETSRLRRELQDYEQRIARLRKS